MAKVKIVVQNIDGVDQIVFRETVDRNGPAVVFLLSDKQALRQAINSINNVGDESLVDGEFGRTEDTTNIPIAIFNNEADADAFLEAKGGDHRKDREPGSVDGYDFKVVRT